MTRQRHDGPAAEADEPRIDASEKVTGAAVYVGDLRLPGMLQGGVLRSPHAHARIVRVDTTRARRLAGGNG